MVALGPLHLLFSLPGTHFLYGWFFGVHQISVQMLKEALANLPNLTKPPLPLFPTTLPIPLLKITIYITMLISYLLYCLSPP